MAKCKEMALIYFKFQPQEWESAGLPLLICPMCESHHCLSCGAKSSGKIQLIRFVIVGCLHVMPGASLCYSWQRSILMDVCVYLCVCVYSKVQCTVIWCHRGGKHNEKSQNIRDYINKLSLWLSLLYKTLQTYLNINECQIQAVFLNYN